MLSSPKPIVSIRRIHWIAGLLLCSAVNLRADDQPKPSLDDRAANLPALAERFFKPLVDRQWASGLVVGVIDERGPRVFAFGRKGAANSEPPDGDTVFEIGSVTKVFTSTLLADMAHRGLVSIDDPVNKFLPADIEPLQCAGREMRLVDLATHTSGLPRMPSNWSPQDINDPYADYTSENLHAFLKGHAQPSLAKALGKSLTDLFSAKPKQNWEYSNLGVGLLGHLLERKAEKPYEELLLERICRPLEMHSTRLTLDDSLKARLIPGHDADGSPNPNWKFACLAPCGGLHSTVNDLLKFVAAHLELTDTPLKPAIDLATKPHFTVNPKLDMGLNWLLRKPEPVFHNGMTGGYNSFVAYSKPRKLGVVVLVDTALGGQTGLLDQVTVPFLRSLIDEKHHDPPKIRTATSVDRDKLKKYAGKYTLVPLVAIFDITCQEDRLYAQLTGQQSLRIFPESETKFFYKAVDAQITFELDSSGAVTRLVLHQNGKDQPAPRQSDSAE
jgi:D-alanyl-D-alanine-carboxypeptidase/D-alanyl-D-alanine-endopeptidase